MKVVKIGDKEIVLSDAQVVAAKILVLPLLNFFLAAGGAILITPEHPQYEQIKKLLEDSKT